MHRHVPRIEDVYPLCCFMLIMIAFNLASFGILPDFGKAVYGSWLAVAVAFVVEKGVEPGLPKTFFGNLRRIVKAHVWPFYVKTKI